MLKNHLHNFLCKLQQTEVKLIQYKFRCITNLCTFNCFAFIAVNAIFSQNMSIIFLVNKQIIVLARFYFSLYRNVDDLIGISSLNKTDYRFQNCSKGQIDKFHHLIDQIDNQNHPFHRLFQNIVRWPTNTPNSKNLLKL